jgi:hypothetical protein
VKNIFPGEVGGNFYDRFEISLLIYTAVGDVMIFLLKDLHMLVRSDLCAKTAETQAHKLHQIETNSWDGVRLNPLGTLVTSWPQMIDQHGAVCGIKIDRVNRSN